MSLREFSKTYHDWKYQGSTVPAHARPFKTFSQGSANDLTKAVLAYFEMKGIKAWRQASEGRYIPEVKQTNVIGQTITTRKGKFIPRSKGAKGSGDITVTLPPLGRRLEIEIKYGKDRQSPDQKQFQAEIEAMGALYMIVKTWEGFILEIEKVLETRKASPTGQGL